MTLPHVCVREHTARWTDRLCKADVERKQSLSLSLTSLGGGRVGGGGDGKLHNFYVTSNAPPSDGQRLHSRCDDEFVLKLLKRNIVLCGDNTSEH